MSLLNRLTSKLSQCGFVAVSPAVAENAIEVFGENGKLVQKIVLQLSSATSDESTDVQFVQVSWNSPESSKNPKTPHKAELEYDPYESTFFGIDRLVGSLRESLV